MMPRGARARGSQSGKFAKKDIRRTSRQCYEKSSHLLTLPAELATDNFGTYEQFTLCRTTGILRESPHHIRRLALGERGKLTYHTVNELAGPSLCGAILPGRANDMILGVNIDFDHICEDCAWIYWNELLQKQIQNHSSKTVRDWPMWKQRMLEEELPDG